MMRRPRWLVPLAAGLLLLAVIAAGCRSRAGLAPPGQPWIFEVDQRASAGTFAQLFWTSGTAFAGSHSAHATFQAGAPSRTLRFRVPPGIRGLRFDPIDAAGEVTISRMELRDGTGAVLGRFNRGSLTARHQVASVGERDGATLIVTTGSDPWVILEVGCLADTPADGRRFTASSLFFSILLTVTLLSGCLWVIGRDLVQAARSGSLGLAGRRMEWVWLAMAATTIFAVKMVALDSYVVTVPTWDQWDAEARSLYHPYYTCGLTWSSMFQLHNEHRIFFSRLLALGLLLVNDQWDPRLQQVVNAALHTLTGVALMLMIWRGLEWRRLDVIALIVVPVFALPYAWENVLGGFQSAFYLFVLFSLLSLWLTTVHPAPSGGWRLGWVCAVCGLFTAAGGILLPLVIGGVALLKFVNAPGQRRELLAALSVAAAVLGLAVATMSPPMPEHEQLKAGTFRIFLAAFFRNAAWPWVEHPIAGILQWLPMAALSLLILVRHGRSSTLERFVIGLGVWVLAQCAVIAYARGGGGLIPATRYHDFLSLGFVANTVVLVTFFRHAMAREFRSIEAALPSPRSRDRVLASLAGLILIVWGASATTAVDRLMRTTLITLSWWRPHFHAHAVNLRLFVATGDAAALRPQQPLDLPYPSPDGLIELLQWPSIRRVLPASIREPLQVEVESVTNAAFVPYGAYPTTPNTGFVRGWGSYTQAGNPAQGELQSRPLAGCRRGTRLKVPVAGYLRLDGLQLGLLRSDRGTLDLIEPPIMAREEWAYAIVNCPDVPFRIVASDRRPDFWFAFREPSEAGWASVRAEQVISSALRLLAAAFVLMVLALKLT